jgi:lysophospholipase L1-like esterase
MRTRRWATPLLALVGLAAALVVAELGLRALGLGDPVLYDNRTAWGYRPLPNQTHTRLNDATIRLNALGTRGPDVTLPRPPGTTRLLFLGDSVTWGGSYVDEAQLFSQIAADVLTQAGVPHVEALNAGVNAWGPRNMLGLVGATGGFDSSVWIVTALDDDFRRERTRIGEVPYFNVAPRFALEELLVLGAYRVLGWYRVGRPPQDLAMLAEENLAAYEGLVAAGRGRGARVLLVWHPTIGALHGRPEMHHAAFTAMAHRLDVALLDLTAAYRAAGDDVYLDGMHLTVAGHRVAGEAIGAALVDLLKPARATAR